MSEVTTLAGLEQEAKAFVNGIRKANGLRALGKLKRGIPLHPGSCTIAMSLEGIIHLASYQGNYVWLEDRGTMAPLVAHFMREYDAGQYPHLELPQSQIKMKKPGERKQTVIYDPATQGKLK